MARKSAVKKELRTNAVKSDVPEGNAAPAETKPAARTRGQLWFAAVKPPMYTVAITPMVVGSLAYYVDGKQFEIVPLFTLLFMSITIIAWLNICNDVFDFDAGIDENKPESIVNLCGATQRARNSLLLLAFTFLGCSFYALASLCRTALIFDRVPLVLMSLAIFGGYAYQSPPFRLGYYGLGEPIAFVTWILGVISAYYTQLCADTEAHRRLISRFPSVLQRLQYILTKVFPSHSFTLLPAAILVAYPTAVILFCSHFHQEDDDRRAGKKSPIVRLGVKRADQVLSLALIVFAALHPFFYFIGALPWQALCLCLLTLPRMFHLATFVNKRVSIPSTLRGCKYIAVRLHFIHGMLLSIGLYVAGNNS